MAWGGTAEPVSRDKFLRRERGQGNYNFSRSANHEQDWQPGTVDYKVLSTCPLHTNTCSGCGKER